MRADGDVGVIRSEDVLVDGQGTLIGGFGGGVVGTYLEIEARLIEETAGGLQAHLEGLGVGGRSQGVGQEAGAEGPGIWVSSDISRKGGVDQLHRSFGPLLLVFFVQAVPDDGLDQAVDGQGIGGDFQEGVAPQGGEAPYFGPESHAARRFEIPGAENPVQSRRKSGNGVRGQEGAEVQEGGGAGGFLFGLFHRQGPGGGHGVVVVVRAGLFAPKILPAGLKKVAGIPSSRDTGSADIGSGLLQGQGEVT